MGGRFVIETLGCKANAYDSELLRAELGRRGWHPAAAGERPDLVLVNSCTVTDEADRQSRRAASRLARRHPGARVVLTGCGAEVAPERYAETRGVAFVVGNQDKPRLVELVLDRLADGGGGVLGDAEAYGRMRARHPEDRRWPAPEDAFVAPPAAEGRTRVNLKVQEGCDAFCTFCVIPYARGPARSLRPSALVAQVRDLVAAGAREVVLTGTALGDYGQDLGDGVGFEALVALILRETGVGRLRLGSLDPRELSRGLRALMASEPRLCPHAHVSLQSPHPAVLKRMNRRYDDEAVVSTLEDLDRLGAALERDRGLPGGIFVGMDVITGFPGETPEIFAWTLERLAALPWHRLHVFPYSEREGTAATRLDGAVPAAERRRRVRALMALSNARLRARHEGVLAAGRPLEVLVEGPARAPDHRPPPDGAAAWVSGHTANYLRVLVPARDPEALANRMVRAAPTAVAADTRAGDAALLGRVLGVEGRP